MKRTVIVAAILCALVYLYRLPYQALAEIREAAKAGDTVTLKDRIDFPAIRESLKSSLVAQLAAQAEKRVAGSDGSGSALAGALASGFAGYFAYKAVDALVTPESITRLISSGTLQPTTSTIGVSAKIPIEDATHRYVSLDRFDVEVPDPPREPVRFVLRRYGLTWRLNDIITPPGSITLGGEK
jgi:hypothetical protein